LARDWLRLSIDKPPQKLSLWLLTTAGFFNLKESSISAKAESTQFLF
jgi:hypothetical protein